MSNELKRIAIVSTGDLQNRKGFVNAFINRAKYLIELSKHDIDVFMICYRKNHIVRCLKNDGYELPDDKVVIDGVLINIIWIDFSFIDYLLYYKLKRAPIVQRLQIKRIAEKLKGYDLIDAHSLFCGTLACYMKQRYNIPFIVTWHGTDIHTTPFNNNAARNCTIKVIENANMNFYVSEALLHKSEQLSQIGKRMVLYNGRNESFKVYDTSKRKLLRQEYDVVNKKVVTFAGSFFPVKNIMLIPAIFKIVNSRIPNCILWMIGDGELATAVKSATKGLPVKYWGNQAPEKMPEYMNCTDVFILPSKNEGLPLTIVEALACGAACVGSRVGGIPEVLGLENTFELDSPTFEQDFANHVIEILSRDTNQDIEISKFDWKKTANIEDRVINDII